MAQIRNQSKTKTHLPTPLPPPCSEPSSLLTWTSAVVICLVPLLPPQPHSVPSPHNSQRDPVKTYVRSCPSSAQNPHMASHPTWRKSPGLHRGLQGSIPALHLPDPFSSSFPSLAFSHYTGLFAVTQISHSSAPGPLHLLSPLPGIFFPQVPT